MKKTVLLAGLLLAVTVACGKQTESPEPATTAPPDAEAPAPAPAPETAPASTPGEDSKEIAAGEAVTLEDEESDTPITQRANEQLAQALAPSAPSAPASGGRWQQGVNYSVLVPAQPTNAPPDKVEVVEMFWYGCGHCYSLEPFIKSYEKQKPAYVVLTRIPVTWSPGHKSQAQLFYTLAALGKLEALHDEVFKEIQQRGNPLIGPNEQDTENRQAAFAAKHGISEKEFRDAYRSMGVRTRLARAEELVRRYRISSVPQVIVNGKYVTDVSKAGGQQDLITLVGDLAAREHNNQ